jgi:cob(I)alamin adenosyltransferase
MFEEKPEWLDGHINGILSQLPAETELLEKEIDDIQPTLPVLHSFVLPGGTIAASQCHVCRTVCRRTERRIIALSRESEVADEPIKFVNRLSDYLFVLARKLNFLARKDEKIWKKTCKSEKK